MVSRYVLPGGLLLGLACTAQATPASIDVSAMPLTPATASLTAAEPTVSACQGGFLSRLVRQYQTDAHPAAASGTAPVRRAMDAPLSSPPFPSAEWQLGGVPAPIGVPDGNAQYPLERALSCTGFGQWMQRHRVEIFGWVTPSLNLSTSARSNYPLSYNTRPNRFELNQAVLNITRVEDTVQTDHLDWGFNISNLYGYDYHYTAAKGVFSNQLLNHPAPGQPTNGQVYGDDPMLFYGDLYIPWVAQGMVIRIGRYLSLPDIEAQFSPQNYLMSHSILYTADPYTQTGILTTTRLSRQWTVQFGINAGNDVAPWNHAARPSLQACVRWVSASNNDMFYPCVNNWNRSDYNYNNVQMYVATWGHRFSDRWHMLTEAYRMYGRQIPGYGPDGEPGVAGSSPYPGRAAEFGAVNYLNFAMTDRNLLSIRNEFYNDEKGQRTGYATRYSSHTIGLTHYLSQDIELQPELRYEHSYDANAYNRGRTNWQAVLLLDAIVHY